MRRLRCRSCYVREPKDCICQDYEPECIDCEKGIESCLCKVSGEKRAEVPFKPSSYYCVACNGIDMSKCQPSCFQRPTPDSALDVQEGGSHYKSMKIQPVEFITANKLDFCEGNAIKYICRHKHKNGIEDLLKAKHYIDLIIELDYTKSDKP